jgi:signal transduction histidine kinase
MWPYTDEESEWLGASPAPQPSAVVPGASPAPLTLEELNALIARGRRLCAEAVAEIARSLYAALRRALAPSAEPARRREAPPRPKDDFLSHLANTLRTPLTSIRSSAEILRDNPDLPPVQRDAFLRVVISEDEHLAALIDRILDASRFEAHTRRWQVEAAALELQPRRPAA